MSVVTQQADLRARVQRVLEDVLRCRVDWSDESFGFRRRPEWGSLEQVRIVARLHDDLGLPRRLGDVDRLDTPQRIVEALTDEVRPDSGTSEDAAPVRGGPVVDRGLANTILDRTRITKIDVSGSQLSYRGHDAAALSGRSSYDAVARLLIDGELAEPDGERRAHLAEGALLARMAAGGWDGTYAGFLARLAGLDLGGCGDHEPSAPRSQGWRILGAATQVVSRSSEPVRFGEEGIAGALTRASTDDLDDIAPGLGALMVLQADHGSSAAAVAVRTAVSAGASLHHGVLAGLATFGGHRHGGAIADVVRLVEAAGEPAALRRVVQHRIASGMTVPGFGHRVYRTVDPRVEPIRTLLAVAEERRRSTWWGDRLRVLREEHAHLEESGAVANVDFYAGPLLRTYGFPTPLLTSLFAVARTAGWVAHAIEQAESRTLIRPRLLYVDEATPKGNE